MDRHTLLRILKPDAIQSMACLLVACLLIGGVYHRELLHVVAQLANVPDSDIQTNVHSQVIQVGDGPFFSNVLIYGFWMAVGLLVYLAYLVISNFLIDAENELIVDTQYRNTNTIWARLSKLVARLGLLAVLIACSWVSWRWVVPALLRLSGQALQSGGVWAYALAAVAGLAVDLYVLWTLVQLVLDYD